MDGDPLPNADHAFIKQAIESKMDSHMSRTPVGATYDFVALERWPLGIAFSEHNVFDVSRPFPVSSNHQDNYGLCGCTTQCRANIGARSCINAATCTVCDASNCSAGLGCGNRFFQMCALNLFSTHVGLVVINEEPIRAGDFIIEYTGELLYKMDAATRPDKRYIVALRPDMHGGDAIYIDACFVGNASRFINHSCKPNCVMYEWLWANTTHLGIFATRDIPELTELTFSHRHGPQDLFVCQCGAPNCVSKKQ